MPAPSPRRDRIVRIVGNNGGGGARIHCFQLNRHLETLGYRTTTFIPSPSFDDPFTSADRVGMDYRHDISLGGMRRALKPIRHEIAFIHSHLMRASLRGAVLAKLLGLPHVVTIHTPVHDGAPSLRDRVARVAWRHAVGSARLVISISRFVRDHAYRQLGLTPDRVPGAIVYNGTDERAAGIEPAPERDASLSLVIVGELTERKNMGDLIWLADRLGERGADIRIHVYGRGPLEPQLRAAAAASGILVLEGYQTDPSAIYGGRHLHLILSRQEAFGRVVTEAMAHALPTLAYRAGAFPELIDHGEDGALVEQREQLLDWLLLLDADRRLLATLSARARQRYERDFSVDRFQRNTVEALANAGLM